MAGLTENIFGDHVEQRIDLALSVVVHHADAQHAAVLQPQLLHQAQRIEMPAAGADVVLPEAAGDCVRRMAAEGQGEGRCAARAVRLGIAIKPHPVELLQPLQEVAAQRLFMLVVGGEALLQTLP